jgi:hypothetical protein
MDSSGHYLQMRETTFRIERELVSFPRFAGHIKNIFSAIQARAFTNNSLKPTNSLYVTIVYIFTYNPSRLLRASIFLRSSSESFLQQLNIHTTKEYIKHVYIGLIHIKSSLNII